VVSERSEEGDSLKEVKAKEKEKRKDGKASKNGRAVATQTANGI
jgi:hypothetical protein